MPCICFTEVQDGARYSSGRIGMKRPIVNVKGLEEVCRQLASGEFEFSRHAFRRAVERDIGEAEIREAGIAAEIIEEYPDDKYAPSVLLLGFTRSRRPLHLQVSVVPSPFVRIITLYQPDSVEWLEFRLRR